MLRIEPNVRSSTKATAWAGSRHVADLHRERDAKCAKVMHILPPLATAAQLRAIADLCNATAEALEAWE